jgi:hypothetical protein
MSPQCAARVDEELVRCVGVCVCLPVCRCVGGWLAGWLVGYSVTAPLLCCKRSMVGFSFLQARVFCAWFGRSSVGVWGVS